MKYQLSMYEDKTKGIKGHYLLSEDGKEYFGNTEESVNEFLDRMGLTLNDVEIINKVTKIIYR